VLAGCCRGGSRYGYKVSTAAVYHRDVVVAEAIQASAVSRNGECAMYFTIVRENAEKGYGRKLTKSQRGTRIGVIEYWIEHDASSVGLSVNIRTARLTLASEAFEVEISSFNQLSDDELEALYTWAKYRPTAVLAWLSEKYGGSERLPGI